MDFDKMSIKECEEKGFRKNVTDYYFNNSLRSLGFHLNLSNEEKLNETLDEHYEDVNDSFISKFEKKTISFFYKQIFLQATFFTSNPLLVKKENY